MAARKSLKKITKPTSPAEPDHSKDFSKGLEEYRNLTEEIKALEESIREQKEILTKRRDQIKDHLTQIVEAAGVKKMETEGGMVTLVRPTRHEVDETYLRATLPGETWKAITETTTIIVQKKFEQAIAEGAISQEVFTKAVKEVPASKGHTKVTIRETKSEGAEG